MSELLPDPPRLAPIPPGTEACGCCDGVERETPRQVFNRGGLASISFRVGNYASFHASLKAGLKQLRTRDDDDFTMGLIDAFACAGDVLTFYQERIANESYLGTARERVSLQEMGRLIGYRLRPGVAAETPLAFTLETPPVPPAAAKPEPGMFVTGVPAEVNFASGLAVRSVPAPDELPQVFETVEPLTARPQWNAMLPWLSEPDFPKRGHTHAWLRGVNTRLRAGDGLVFAGAEYLANRNSNRWDFRILDSVVADNANDRTYVSWRRPLGSIVPPQNPASLPRVFALRQRASVYGHNAPAFGVMPEVFRGDYSKTFPRRRATDFAVLFAANIPLVPEWPEFVISPSPSSIDLDTTYPEITLGSFVVLAKGDFNSPVEGSSTSTYVELYVVAGVSEVSREEFALAGKVTRLDLSGDNYAVFSEAVRETSVFAQSEELALTEYPVSSAVEGDQIPVSVTPDGLEAGRRLLIRGSRARDGVAQVHAATLVAASGTGTAGRTILEIDPPLPEPLTRASVVVHANVALATHGETVTQILGAGNAATPFQRFELKQLPLTYRAAASEIGAASELTVRVDGIEWTEVDTAFGTEPRQRVYSLRTDEQGRNFVQFGDGVRGARLPSGVNNVRATYRKGLGATGNVAAESLTQPTVRPLGLKGVSNPLPAMGGTDAEAEDQARQTMPLMTRTLGRAVSLLDYEDFARAFAGVAKARAQVLQLSSGPVIAITIAGPDNVIITPDNPVWINLADALAGSGDPHVAVRLLPHRPVTFRLGLKIKREAAYEAAAVLAAVESALRTRFGFAARALGEPVLESEVITAAQSVPGVVAVDLDYLYGGSQPRSQTVRSRQVRLLAARMSVRANAPQADEILTLDPAPFDRLEEMP